MNKQTIVILEGHDKSGKSTIATALSEQLNIPIFKVVRNKYWWDPEINLKYLTEGITQFIEQTKTSVILDRWVPSDYMYSKLFNRPINYDTIFNIDERLSKLNTTIIYCHKNKEAFEFDEEDKEFINMTMYDKMTELYREYSDKSKCNHLWLNTSDENLFEQTKQIKAMLTL